jgi:hypothetical protein
MVERRGIYRVWWGNLWERDHLEDPDLDCRIIMYLYYYMYFYYYIYIL